MKDIDEYAEWTWTTWGDGNKNVDAPHAAFGFAEETGEVLGVFKREARGEGFNQDTFVKEMGDAIYYWARLCISKGVLPSEILEANKIKLMDRKARGVIRGSGDDR